MPPQARRALRLETTWIREYARTYLPSEAGFSFSADDLRAAGISLIGIRHVLGHGVVVSAEKLNEAGATWIVEGNDHDEVEYRLMLKVISESIDVTLRKVDRIVRKEERMEKVKVKKQGKKDDGYDAA